MLAVANGVISGFGGDQNLRVWAELNGLDFMAFNSINPTSKTAMMLACVQGNLKYCQWLFVRVGSNKEILQCGNNETNVPMDWACINGHLAVGEWFVDEDACNMIEIYSKNKVTLMHIVCLYGHLDVCQWLFDKGADIQTLANDGEMPMHWACINGHLQCVNGCLIRAQILKHSTITAIHMHHTCIGGHLKVCKWLFENVQILKHSLRISKRQCIWHVGSGI